MSPEVLAAIISGAIAVLALVISYEVSQRQTAIQERVAAIQERLTAIEEARRAEEIASRAQARVTASVEHEPTPRGGQQPWLRLHNGGPALARGVNVEVDKQPQTPDVIGLEGLPADLQPGQSMRFLVSVGLQDNRPLRITVRWADDAGDHAKPYTLPVT